MTRSRKILALVPKCGAKSDVESSESSEDEFQICRAHQDVSEDSPPVHNFIILSFMEEKILSDSILLLKKEKVWVLEPKL